MKTFILFAFFACLFASPALAQEAGEFTMTFSYGPAVDEQMTAEHGAKWVNDYIKPGMREKWKNEKSQALEAYKKQRARLFDFDNVGGLNAADKKALKDLWEKQEAWETEQKRLADSTAAAQEIGSLFIGKSLQPRFDFFRDYEGGGGGAPHSVNFADGPPSWFVPVAFILALAVVAGVGYGLYVAGRAVFT